MKIATWNVNSVRVRIGQVLSWLDLHRPDALALQETKVVDEDFPEEAFLEIGYHAYYSGQKTYNGVAVLTAAEGEDISTSFPGLDETQKRYISITIGSVRIINIYVPNGLDIGTEQYAYKLDWLHCFSRYLAEERTRHAHTVVLGDFNITPADIDVFDPNICSGQILCSEAERQALIDLMGSEFVDVFRQRNVEKQVFSWWDYRGGAFRRNRGLRIDLLLASKQLAETCRYCEIDREQRMLEKPSDHAPVFALFED